MNERLKQQVSHYKGLKPIHGGTIYISGPITGVPDDNAQAFEEAGEYLKHYGYVPINPLDLSKELQAELGVKNLHDIARSQFLAMDILTIIKYCDGIYLLKNWHMSPGARFEVECCLQFSKSIFFQAGC